MHIAPWPLVGRDLLVRLYKPGDEATSEGPFRTLRRHEWATAGVRVTTRAHGRAAGQVTLFSMLNLEAVRLARCEKLEAATRLATRARELEASKDFAILAEILSGLSRDIVEAVVRGVIAPELPEARRLWGVLERIARRTERVRCAPQLRASSSEMLMGQVSAHRGESVILTMPDGTSSIVPRWLALSVHREHLGDKLAVLTDRLGDSSALAIALPALDIERPARFDPFARDDRIGALSMSDREKVAQLSGAPRVLVPVTIEE